MHIEIQIFTYYLNINPFVYFYILRRNLRYQLFLNDKSRFYVKKD